MNSVTRKPGRPSIAPEVQQVTILLPANIYDLVCREALARDVSIAVVIREAVFRSRMVRGELR